MSDTLKHYERIVETPEELKELCDMDLLIIGHSASRVNNLGELIYIDPVKMSVDEFVEFFKDKQ